MLFDWKLPAKATAQEFEILAGGKTHKVTLPKGTKPGSFTRFTVKIEDGSAPTQLTIKGVEELEIMNVFFAGK